MEISRHGVSDGLTTNHSAIFKGNLTGKSRICCVEIDSVLFSCHSCPDTEAVPTFEVLFRVVLILCLLTRPWSLCSLRCNKSLCVCVHFFVIYMKYRIIQWTTTRSKNANFRLYPEQKKKQIWTRSYFSL